MSAMKPIFRELREAILDGFAHAKDQLHHVADNIHDKIDDVIRQLKDMDVFNGQPSSGHHTPGSNNSELVPRPECLDADGRIDWSHAPHDGFTLDANGNPINRHQVPAAGDQFDRYGTPDGRFVSPVTDAGPFSYESRSLPYHENPNAYHRYEWLESPANVESVYNKLDSATRADVDAVLDKYDLDLSDLAYVTRGEAAAIPAWGTPGGATQDLLPVSVELLDIMGMIKEVG